MAKEIMYIGKKPLKRDNVNQVPDRVWNGVGDVVAVTDAEAIKLTLPLYSGIWMDVTKLDESARTKIVEALRERFRAEERAVTPAGEVARALNTLSTEELEKELRRRRERYGKPSGDKAPASQNAAPNPNSRATEGEETERPESTEEVVLEIAGAITALDKENRSHFDDDGNPVLESIVAALGYKVSQSELNAAVALIKGE
jgi:hypothetical protein